MKIELIDDMGEALDLWREMQGLYGSDDKWPGNDHNYWRLTDGKQDMGLMSAVYRPEKGYVYLSYAIIHPWCPRAGLQRRLIRYRLQWAKRQGAVYAVTYTLLHNYPSIANLLKCGFRFAREPRDWAGVGNGVHYFEKAL